MENNVENTKIKKSKISLAIILLIVVILIASIFGAYAIYTTTQNKNIGVDIAQFSFNVDLKKINNGQDSVVNLADTILGDTTGNVQSGKIAPGTYGAFDLMMDGSSSGVSLDYYININTRINTKSEEGYLPRNLKFYRLKQGKTEGIINEESLEDTNEATARFEQVGADGSIRITGDISAKVTDEYKIKSERIYWIWPYETELNTDNDDIATVEEGDMLDSEDALKNNGKTIILPIKVSAEQKTATSKKRLAYMVKVGDVVNYNPLEGMSAEDISTEKIGTYTAKKTSTTEEMNASIENSTTGYDNNQEFNVETNAIIQWKVLGINENEEVELMGITPNTLYLKGQAGYNNGIEILNGIAGIYGHGKGAIGARSMTVEDIEQYTSYNKNTYVNSNNFAYGTRKEYTFNNTGSNTGIHEGVEFTIEDINGDLIKDTNQRTNLIKGSIAEVQQTYYQYKLLNNQKAGIPNDVYEMLGGCNYWLASRYYSLLSGHCTLGLRNMNNVNSGKIDGYGMFGSHGYVNSDGRAVASVVFLKSGIQTSGETGNGWEIDV